VVIFLKKQVGKMLGLIYWCLTSTLAI